MIHTDAITHRPLLAAAAAVGVLLVSACSTAAESTPTLPVPAAPAIDLVADLTPDPTQTMPTSIDNDLVAQSTTSTPPPTTAPFVPDVSIDAAAPATSTLPTTPLPTVPATAPPAGSTPIEAVAVSDRTVFGVGLFEAVDVDAVSNDISAHLGSPTTDSGWQSMVGQTDCTGSTDFRVLWWDDFRMTFERYQTDDVVRDELSAWTIGDPTLFATAPFGDLPTPARSDIVTAEGIGLGSTLADVAAAWANVNTGGDDRLVVIDRGGSLLIGLDEGDQVVGFGNGPFDCHVDEMR